MEFFFFGLICYFGGRLGPVRYDAEVQKVVN